MASDLEKKIISQIEYYFGDINLPRDKFLQEKIKEDEGWVTLEVLLSFKRLASLSKDEKVIADAIGKSENKLVVVSADGKKIRRSPDIPLPENNDERQKELMSRTAYAKRFPLDEELDAIVEFLKEYGVIESCQRRSWSDKVTNTQKFKGSCFIIFKDVESCKKFVEAESIQYKDVELTRKMQADYFEEKKKEMEERKNRKKNKAKPEAVEKDTKPVQSLTPGTVVFFDGFEEGHSHTREDLKEEVVKITTSAIAFIDFGKGLAEGYLRFSEENAGKEFIEKLTEAKLTVGETELKFRLLDDDEAEQYRKTKSAADKLRHKHKSNKSGGRFNRKRKGNFGGAGPRSKK